MKLAMSDWFYKKCLSTKQEVDHNFKIFLPRSIIMVLKRIHLVRSC